MIRRLRFLGLFFVRGFGDRGRRADSPADIPLLGWRDILIRVWRNGKADNLNVLAAGIAFYLFLALLPLIASTAMIYGLATEPAQVVADMRKLIVILPEAAQGPIARRAAEVIAASRGQGWALPSALLLTLYAGARGTRAILAALNVIYGEGDETKFARRWGVPFGIAIGITSVMTLALVAIALFGHLEDVVPGRTGLFRLAVRTGAWLLVTAGVGLGSAALYRYGPVRQHARWRWIVPGALATTVLWLLGSFAFGIYVANFGRFDITYGSLAAVVILQLWIYFSAFILLLGAKLNAEIELQTMRDTTVGPARPAGRRRASTADGLGEIPTIAPESAE
jgi:membrane protein